jgi:hypothetical protein
MRVAVATHAPHGSKHGTTFADTFPCADGATIVIVGAVVGGVDRAAVGDLLRAAARALVTSADSLAKALAAFDRIVLRHAREHRDEELAALVALVAMSPDGSRLEFAGSGQLHCALVSAAGGGRTHLHGHDAPLGTGFAEHAHDASLQEYGLQRGDVVVAATFAVVPPSASAGADIADELVRHAGAVNASVAVITID